MSSSPWPIAHVATAWLPVAPVLMVLSTISSSDCTFFPGIVSRSTCSASGEHFEDVPDLVDHAHHRVAVVVGREIVGVDRHGGARVGRRDPHAALRRRPKHLGRARDAARGTSPAHETPPWESIWPRSPPLTSATDINRARNWPSTRSRSGRVLKIAITSPVGVASGPLRVAANF